MDIDIDALDAAIAEGSFSGLVTIDVGDERVLERAEGFAHRALQVPVTASTRFAVASGSKSFTALTVMRLIARTDLELTTPVREILGTDLPLIDDAVTVEHLMEHTSGIGDYLDEEADWEVDDYIFSAPLHTLDRAEGFVPELDGFPQVTPPGERFSYNNGGYVVLALVAERVSGQPFPDLLHAEVCEPAGLDATRFLRSDDLPGDAALGYLDATGNRTNVLHMPVRGNGDGGIFTTADDLHRFWRVVLDGQIVEDATVAEMIRPRHDYPEEGMRGGLGFWLHHANPALMLEGYDPGMSFRSTHDPATATTVTVMGNTSEGAWPVIGALASIFD